MKKKCEVVLLDSEKPTRLIYNKLTNGLVYENSLSAAIIAVNQMGYMYKNMCIISDDEFKNDDYVLARYHDTYQQIERVKEGLISWLNERMIPFKKIIATTDRSLIPCVCQNSYPCDDRDCLSRPSNEFIQAYVNSFNKGLPIEEILVEYDSVLQFEKNPEMYGTGMFNSRLSDLEKLKIAPDNTISIFPVSTPEKVYTKEEVEQIISKLTGDVLEGLPGLEHHSDSIAKEWIKENLN